MAVVPEWGAEIGDFFGFDIVLERVPVNRWMREFICNREVKIKLRMIIPNILS